MLRQYQIKNFKAFAEVEPLPLRPITLIYGPNSAGKSSIIQSLMLLKQTLDESEDSDTVLLPKGKLVDLGNYREFIHLHEVHRNFSVKFQLDVNLNDIKPLEALDNLSDTLSRVYSFLHNQFIEFPTISLELEFSATPTRSNISIYKVNFWIGRDDCPVISYGKTEQGLKVSHIYSQHSFWRAWWEEYALVLPNRVFSQLNITLHNHGMSKISSRNRVNTIRELEAQKLLLSKQFQDVQVEQEILSQQLDNLAEQMQDLEQRLMALRSQQEGSEKPLIEELETFSRGLGYLLSLNSQPFFDWNRIPNDLTEEQMIQFERGQFLWKQICQLQQEHRVEQEPLTILKAKLQSQIAEAKKQDLATGNKLEQITQNIAIIELLQNLWGRFSSYSLEQAIEDYRNMVETHAFSLVSNFLPTETLIRFPELEIQSLHRIENDFLMGVYEGLEVVQFLMENTSYAGDLIRFFLKNTAYLGPMRDYPERFYLLGSDSIKRIGKSGTGTSDLLFNDPDFLKMVNQRLKRFDIGYEIKVVSFQNNENTISSDVYAIRLVDNFSNVDVSLLDVGFGVSQILPVIIQSLFSNKQTIIIEQPEVHIHPRLQTELGDLFIDSINEHNNQFIVETHSEHLMLRLQKRIREGRLNPDDVSVLYVARDTEGVRCTRLRLNSRGKFIDKWPHGFFEEDVHEVFG